MPFKVTIKRNSKLALVSWPSADTNVEGDLENGKHSEDIDQDEMQMGKWKEKLSVGDFVFIQGAQFKVVPTVIRKVRRSNNNDGSAGARSRRTSKSDKAADSEHGVGASQHNSEPEQTPAGDAGNSGANNAYGSAAIFVVKTEIATENHIQLDRFMLELNLLPLL